MLLCLREESPHWLLMAWFLEAMDLSKSGLSCSKWSYRGQDLGLRAFLTLDWYFLVCLPAPLSTCMCTCVCLPLCASLSLCLLSSFSCVLGCWHTKLTTHFCYHGLHHGVPLSVINYIFFNCESKNSFSLIFCHNNKNTTIRKLIDPHRGIQITSDKAHNKQWSLEKYSINQACLEKENL